MGVWHTRMGKWNKGLEPADAFSPRKPSLSSRSRGFGSRSGSRSCARQPQRQRRSQSSVANLLSPRRLTSAARGLLSTRRTTPEHRMDRGRERNPPPRGLSVTGVSVTKFCSEDECANFSARHPERSSSRAVSAIATPSVATHSAAVPAARQAANGHGGTSVPFLGPEMDTPSPPYKLNLHRSCQL